MAATFTSSTIMLHQQAPPLQVVTAWNGMAISAFANAARVLSAPGAQAQRRFPVEGRPAADYLEAAQKVLASPPG